MHQNAENLCTGQIGKKILALHKRKAFDNWHSETIPFTEEMFLRCFTGYENRSVRLCESCVCGF